MKKLSFKRKTLLILLSVAVTVFFAAIPVAAYFMRPSGSHTADAGATGTQKVIEIFTEGDLIAYGTAEEWNDDVLISAPEQRIVLKLMYNMALTKAVTLTADLSLDLNGHTLNLSGHNLTIKHNYFSTIHIVNGQIVDTTELGKLMLITPNSLHIIDDGLIDESLIGEWQFDEVSLAQEIFAFFENAVTGRETENYYHSDIPFIFNYYNYPVGITYSSSAPAVISASGKVTPAASPQDVTVTMNLQFENSSASDTFVFKILPKGHADWLIAGERFFDNYTSVHDSGYDDEGDYYYHVIYSDVRLLQGVSYAGLTYTYSPLVASDMNETKTIIEIGSSYRTIQIDVTVTDAQNRTHTFVRYFNAEAELSNYDVVDMIVNEVFGDSVLTVYKKSNEMFFDDETTVNYFQLPYATDYLQYNIVELSYDFIGNNDYYFMTDNVISVNMDNPPSILDPVYLLMSFRFSDGDPRNIEKRIPIVFNPSTGGGDEGEGTGAGDRYYDYFRYLNSLLVERTNNLLTYTSFVMPKMYYACNFEYYLTVEATEGSYTTTQLNQMVYVTDYSDDYYQITIDISKLPMESITVLVKYGFKMNTEDVFTSPSTYRYLSFTVPGVIHLGTGQIEDANLFAAMKTFFGDLGGDFILRSQFDNPDLTSFTLSDSRISNFKGIEYMRFVTDINLSGCNFGNALSVENNFACLGQMASVKNVNLSSNNLTTIYPLPIMDDLEVLDLSNNSISLFFRLENPGFKSLSRVYVQDNLTGDANYGTGGQSNTYTFITLTNDRNVEFIMSSGGAVYTIPTGGLSLARAVSGIIYQKDVSSVSSAYGVLATSKTGGGVSYQYSYADITSVQPKAFTVRVNISGSTAYVTRVLLIN